MHCNECDIILEQGAFIYNIYTDECLTDIFCEMKEEYYIPNICENCLRKLGKLIERELKKAENMSKKFVN